MNLRTKIAIGAIVAVTGLTQMVAGCTPQATPASAPIADVERANSQTTLEVTVVPATPAVGQTSPSTTPQANTALTATPVPIPTPAFEPAAPLIVTPSPAPTPVPTLKPTSTPYQSDYPLQQLSEATNALAEVSRLTKISHLLDRKAYDKARYQSIIASIDEAIAEVRDLDDLKLPLWVRQQYPLIHADGALTTYLYLPGAPTDVSRAKAVLGSLRGGYVEKISQMKWAVEYLPPTLEEVLGALGVTPLPKEAVEEARKRAHLTLASDITGKRVLFSEAELILESSYFLPYLNRPVPVGLSPEPIELGTFSFAPLAVDVRELENLVSQYTTTGIGTDLGVVPRLEGDMLFGFVVWAKRTGTGSSFMKEDIPALGKMSELGYTGRRALDELPSRKFSFPTNLRLLEAMPTPGETK